MSDLVFISFTALFGVLTWIYQKAWERQERRLARYEKVMGGLSGLTVEEYDSKRIGQFLETLRSLWLFAPDEVIRAANAFIEAVENSAPDSDKKKKLGEFVLVMRRDVSFRRVILPVLCKSSLTACDFKMKGPSSRS